MKITRRIYMPRRYARLSPPRVRTRIPSTRRLANGCRCAKFYPSVCDNNFPRRVASLLSWRCLAASTSAFLLEAMSLRPSSATVSTHTSAFNAVAFQSPAMPNVKMSLCTQMGWDGNLHFCRTTSYQPITITQLSDTITIPCHLPQLLPSIQHPMTKLLTIPIPSHPYHICPMYVSVCRGLIPQGLTHGG